ncbi:hypothetical protein HOY80DRAFT_1099964 [Tuber brumale]|nr:hypothetical protein HOY80DRAFT_1099964 [Tuber brumale]
MVPTLLSALFLHLLANVIFSTYIPLNSRSASYNLCFKGDNAFDKILHLADSPSSMPCEPLDNIFPALAGFSRARSDEDALEESTRLVCKFRLGGCCVGQI